MILLDGKSIADLKTKELKQKVSKLDKVPKFCIIQVGDIFESNKYISNKIKKAKELDVEVFWNKYPMTIKEDDLINEIKNIEVNYDGLIVQLPLPEHINSQNVLDSIPLEKDIDGLSTRNMKNFYNDESSFFIPATAKAILTLLESYNIDLHKEIMVIGESNLVGKPIKHLLSKYAKSICSRNKETGIEGSNKYDILIVAAGSINLINNKDVKENAIIVDVGINKLDNNKLVGDVNFEDVKDKIYAISPVPGGVGPLTVISLLENLIDKILIWKK